MQGLWGLPLSQPMPCLRYVEKEGGTPPPRLLGQEESWVGQYFCPKKAVTRGETEGEDAGQGAYFWVSGLAPRKWECALTKHFPESIHSPPHLLHTNVHTRSNSLFLSH